MITINKNNQIPEEYITFVIDDKIINKYVKAGNDIILKKISKDKVSVSFKKNNKRISILNSIIVVDMLSMRKDGINTKNALLSFPTIKFNGKCEFVCQYEIIDDMCDMGKYIH